MTLLATFVATADSAQTEARAHCTATILLGLFAPAATVRTALESLLATVRSRLATVWSPAPLATATSAATAGVTGPLPAAETTAMAPVLRAMPWSLPCGPA